MQKRLINLAVLVIAALISLIGTPGLSNFVLCLGSDGHLELEYSVNGKCGASTQASQGLTDLAADGESHCGTCTDVTFISESEDCIRPANGLGAPLAQDAAPATFLLPFHLVQATVGLLPKPPPSVNPHLVRLVTIRLLV